MSVDGSAGSGAALRLRIGELSRRTGVGADTLRAWERRYGLLSPDRSAGGYRLYTDADAARVRAMQTLIGEGLSAAEAAEQVRAKSSQAAARPPSRLEAQRLAARLRDALERLDEASANAVLDEALSGLSLEFVVETVIFEVLRGIGTDWESGELSIGQEHFATNLLRGRLLGLARGWGAGSGPWAVLACPPGERHDLGLICFGLALWRRGWRIAFLGADSPVATVAETAGSLGAELVVVAATDPSRVEEVADELRALGGDHQLAFGGAGVSPGLADALGARSLPTGPTVAATSLDSVLHSA
jgi:MerR family transcriptional regulator, light-induced transcriptional regulator